MYRLASHLHLPVAEVLERISAQEFTRWQVWLNEQGILPEPAGAWGRPTNAAQAEMMGLFELAREPDDDG